MNEPADVRIAAWLEGNGYHPRSSKHGDALCRFLLEDLVGLCAFFRQAAAEDKIVFRLNFTIDPQSLDRWNADLVVGPPTQQPEPDGPRIGVIAQGDPREIWLAIDAKTIMTEHGKARRNRQRDLNSFHDILHRKNPETIVGGLLLVNLADRFQTPLARQEGGITVHKNIDRLVGEIVGLMEALPQGNPGQSAPGLEALGVIVVAHSNVPGEPTRLITGPPAPAKGDRLNYESFLRNICAAFTERFAT